MASRANPPRKTVKERGGNAGEAIPLRYGDDPYVWACWLYYEDRMTQGEIAETMGISRATVNTYLAEARERGIVNIAIDPERLSALTIAQELRRHFGLHDCLVIPSNDNAGSLIDRLGIAGARALNQTVRSADTIAVAWGRTVMAVAEKIARDDLQDVSVIQATGGTTASFSHTPEACAARLAASLRARCINLTAPALVSSAEIRELLLEEPVIAGQLAALARANRLLFGISSLRPNSTPHTSGFFDSVATQLYLERNAVGVIAGRFIDGYGKPVAGPLDERTIGLRLDMFEAVETKIAVAGGIDKVGAILGALRGGYIDILVTDAATGRGILQADGVAGLDRKLVQPRAPEGGIVNTRTVVKKLINKPADVMDEMLDGAVHAHENYLRPIDGDPRALVALRGPREGKVGLVIGGGSGHEPCFLGYVGKGLADAVAIGNVFSAPPPDPVHKCARAASGDRGVLFVYGNYAGDIMNFEMAADLAKADGIEVRTVITTDDIASSPAEDHEGRRGVAGNFFTFKIAGAACDRMWPLDACEAVTRRANSRTYTVGVALEPCSLPQTRTHNFEIGPDEMEIGMGIHGEPGVTRDRLRSADEVTDAVMDRIFAEMHAGPGDRVAVLVNSLGATPLMELYILHRRVRQRLDAKNIAVHASWTGHYCTSLDMAGASITVLHLNDELTELLDHPCDTAFLAVR